MQVITFGRGSQNSFTVNDSSVSKTHCQIIKYENGRFCIVDFGSTNGTYVNNRRITGEVQLNWNDEVRIGNTVLRWQSYFGTSTRKTDNTLAWVLGSLGAVVVIAVIIVLAFSNMFHKDGGYLDNSQGGDLSSIGAERRNPISFNGTKLSFNMSLDDVQKENPNVRIEKKNVPGYSNIIEEAEDFDYYNFYNSNDERTCVFILNNNVINSVTILDRSFTTQKNISIGCTWEQVANTYPEGEWILRNYSQYDFYTSSYHLTWIYYYVPEICTYFVFKGSQFTELQMQSICQTVKNDKISISSISSSVYASFASSVSVYQIVLSDCGNIEPKQPETYNIDDIDTNTTKITDPSGNTTRNVRNELIGIEWEHFHNNASSGDKTTEILFVDNNNLVIRNFPPPDRVRVSESDLQQLAKIKRVDAKYYYDNNAGTGYYISTAGEKISFKKNGNTINFDFGRDIFIFFKKSQDQNPKTDKTPINICSTNTYTITGIGKSGFTYPDGKKVDAFSYKGTQCVYLTIYDNNFGTYKIDKVTAIGSTGNYTATFKDYVHDLSENFIGYQYQGGYQDFSISNWIITITKR